MDIGAFAYKKIRKLSPATILLFSYLIAICVGAGMLLLPFSTVSADISFIDALYTATSAVCVTGLVVVDTGSYFTLTGQWIILVLIQLGGLGIMTVSVIIFRLIGRAVSFRQRMAMQDVFAHTPREDIYQLLKSICWFTLVSEVCGAIFLFIHWIREFTFGRALYMAVFHSVSAFCNAGFALFANSFMDYRAGVLLNLTICVLVVLGGIGFPVIHDIYKTFLESGKKRVKLSVQTKIVLITTVILIVSGMAVFWGIEQEAVLKNAGFKERFLTSLFQSVTCRTAGFNTVDIGRLGNATLTFMMFLMFFGASPGSCGGGVKTTTLAVMSAFALSRVRGNMRVNMFRKSITDATVTRSISLFVISTALIGTLFLVLVLSAPVDLRIGTNHGRFLSYLFEVVSAFGTVGLSMGVTTEMNAWEKSLIILTMFIGRVGVLTFSYVIAGMEATKGVEYAEENVMIG